MSETLFLACSSGRPLIGPENDEKRLRNARRERESGVAAELPKLAAEVKSAVVGSSDRGLVQRLHQEHLTKTGSQEFFQGLRNGWSTRVSNLFAPRTYAGYGCYRSVLHVDRAFSRYWTCLISMHQRPGLGINLSFSISRHRLFERYFVDHY